jgi:hypothetical protein
VPLVDQPGVDRLSREVGPAHQDVSSRCRFQLSDRFGVEVSLDPRSGAGYRLQRLRVHDLVRRLPYLREILHVGRLVGEGERLPRDHHLVYPAPVEVGADRPLEVVDEGVDLLVRLSPVEVAFLVRHVAVERRDRRVDQFRHDDAPRWLGAPPRPSGGGGHRGSPGRGACGCIP